MNYKPTLRMSLLVAMLCQASLVSAQAIDDVTLGTLDREFAAIQPKMVEWRRDIHQNPELSGQEVRTAQLIAFTPSAWKFARASAGTASSGCLRERGPARSSPCVPTSTPCPLRKRPACPSLRKPGN